MVEPINNPLKMPTRQEFIQAMLDAYSEAGDPVIGTLPDVGMEAALDALIYMLPSYFHPENQMLTPEVAIKDAGLYYSLFGKVE